jgi:hypothetical protein
MESWFKPTPDGQKVFYPWGNLNKRGYVISSDCDYDRLRRRINLWIGVSIASTAGAIRLKGFLAGCAVMAVSLVFYLTWMLYLLRRFQPYDAPQSDS